jgi:hypothetical protein
LARWCDDSDLRCELVDRSLHNAALSCLAVEIVAVVCLSVVVVVVVVIVVVVMIVVVDLVVNLVDFIQRKVLVILRYGTSEWCAIRETSMLQYSYKVELIVGYGVVFVVVVVVVVELIAVDVVVVAAAGVVASRRRCTTLCAPQTCQNIDITPHRQRVALLAMILTAAATAYCDQFRTSEQSSTTTDDGDDDDDDDDVHEPDGECGRQGGERRGGGVGRRRIAKRRRRHLRSLAQRKVCFIKRSDSLRRTIEQ